jgi:hypothetical protein
MFDKKLLKYLAEAVQPTESFETLLPGTDQHIIITGFTYGWKYQLVQECGIFNKVPLTMSVITYLN